METTSTLCYPELQDEEEERGYFQVCRASTASFLDVHSFTERTESQF